MTRKIVEIVFATAIAFGAWNSPAQAQSSAKVAEGGYTIAFASLAPHKTNIFIADGDGENARPLLAMPDVDYNPSLSRDGAWIVFTSLRDGSADIYRVHPDGSGLERLTDDPAFDDQGVLSPDAKFLAFVSTRGGKANIWLLDMQSRKLKNLTPDSTGDFRPAWSPDGERIAFSSDRDSTFPGIFFAASHTTEIYVMRRDGSDIRRVTTVTAATVGSPSWSPDDSRIVFYHASSGDIVKVTMPGIPTQAAMQIVSVDWNTG
jgi:TolB protein